MKYKIAIVIILVVIVGLYFYITHMTNYKFNRCLYYSPKYIESSKKKYLRENVYVDELDNPLFQMYNNKSKIPYEVYENIKKYAPEYNHIVLDDNEIRDFLKTYYTDIVLNTFDSLKQGPHKSDLARYCILYIYGGLYMDIKTELIKPLKEIFNKGDDVFYTVDGSFNGIIYQGIMKTPKKHPVFLSLIDYIVKTKNPFDYLDFCRDFYVQLYNEFNKINEGFMIGNNGKYYILKEKCSFTDNSLCYDGFDRHGMCCFIWDGKDPVIKGRRSSYPWK